MDFILSPKIISTNWESQSFGSYYLYYIKNSKIPEKEIIAETQDLFILCDANISLISVLLKDLTISSIENSIGKLKNGFLIVFDKRDSKIYLYTDIFGFCQIYYLNTENSVIISSDFNHLLPFSKKQTYEYALLDIVLFNYTLLDRTLINDIKRIKGGTKVVIYRQEFKMSVTNNFADNFKPVPGNNIFNHKNFSHILTKSFSEDLAIEKKNNLTFTAGFDSRALLAVSKHLKLDISTYTFGQKGNIEQELTKDFIYGISTKHEQLFLDKEYLNKLPGVLESFLESNLDNPVILDLPHYKYFQEHINDSNLIAGFMGGELMSGQSVGAQVTFTRFAADLLASKGVIELRDTFNNTINNLEVLNGKYINTISDGYLSTLSDYFSDTGYTNYLRFLINEKYAKFFGAVNKIFRNNSNLIVPFMDQELICYILNSGISFLRSSPHLNSPFAHVKSKILYAKSIKYLCPDLSETKLDRLYTINDLCLIYRFPKVISGYIQSHFFKKNKIKFPKPHDYDLWYKKIILEHINNNPFHDDENFFNKGFYLKEMDYDKLPFISKKRLSNIMGIGKALKIIKSS